MKELKEENLEIIKEISLLFMLVEKAIDYEKRINKAIEMIKLSLIQENKTLYQNELEWLLDILQGEENDK